MQHLGRYRLDAPLGSGAFATVWRAYDPDLDHTVAIKVLAENWATNAEVCSGSSPRPGCCAASTTRPSSGHGVGTAPVEAGVERPYFVMDLIEGGTLASRVGSLPSREALSLAAEAAEAVQALHDAGALHRDLKPSNLLVDPDRSSTASWSPTSAAPGVSAASGPGTPAPMITEDHPELRTLPP